MQEMFFEGFKSNTLSSNNYKGVYGANIGSSSTNKSSSKDFDDKNGHWVTVNHKHIFIEDEKGGKKSKNSSSKTSSNKGANSQSKSTNPNKMKGKPTGGAASVIKRRKTTKQVVAEVAIGPVYTQASYNYAKNNYGPDTSGMLDMAHEKRFNPKYEKDTIKLKNWNDDKVASDKKYLVEKVGEQFMDFGFDINEIPGYFFKNNSEPSKRIANDADFLDKIKKNKENILNGKDISMEFPNYGHNKKSNLHFAFGHIDIRNGYLDKEGNLHVKVYDTYDFNKNNKTPLNQAGREQMLKGNLKPFFTIHDILIPKEKVGKLWK